MALIFLGAYFYLYYDYGAGQTPFGVGDNRVEAPFLVLNQPDETANYLFIRQLALRNEFGYPEELSSVANNQAHPRSTTVVNGVVEPIGFPGFIVLAALWVKICLLFLGDRFFNAAALSFTPLLASIAPFFLYGAMRRFVGLRTAFVSALLLFFTPAWWYYASRPFQHYTLFIFCLLATLWCAAVATEKVKLSWRWRGWVLSGVFFWLLAIYVRPGEAVWLIGLGLCWWCWARKNLRWQEYGLIILLGALAMILFLATQTAFYGHPLASGYIKPLSDGSAGLVLTGSNGIGLFQALFLPFGFHPRVILDTLRGYFVDLFGFWTLVGLISLIVALAVSWQRKNWAVVRYITVFSAVGVFLLVYYGSWGFFDNLAKVTAIGSSQTRYFLPIYVLLLTPAIGWWLAELWQAGKKQWQRALTRVAVLALALGLFCASVRDVYGGFEGLTVVKNNVEQYLIWQAEIECLTPADSVIVTRYADKYLFPGRKVIAGWQDAEQVKALISLAQASRPVYLYDLKLVKEQEDGLQAVLTPAGWRLEPAIAAWEGLELRAVVKVK